MHCYRDIAYSLIGSRGLYIFGDINSVRPGDNYHCLITGYININYNVVNWAASVANIYPDTPKFGDSTQRKLARSHHQLPGVVAAYWKGLNTYMGEGMYLPNPADNGFYVGVDPIPVHDDLSFRGVLPGMVVPYATATGYDKYSLKDLPNIPNCLIKLWLVQRGSADNSSSYARLIGFDIKGPWR